MALTNRETRAVPERLTRWTGYLLAHAHLRCHDAFAQALAPLGLSPKSFGILTVIVERGPLSQAALGETLRIDRTSIVAHIDELERAGYVERGRNHADRRVHSLQATPAGLQALRSAERLAGAVNDEMFDALDAEERAQLDALLARIAD